MIIQVHSCARCGFDHAVVEARQFNIPFAPPEAKPLVWTHWATCPRNGDPILVMVADDKINVLDAASN